MNATVACGKTCERPNRRLPGRPADGTEKLSRTVVIFVFTAVFQYTGQDSLTASHSQWRRYKKLEYQVSPPEVSIMSSAFAEATMAKAKTDRSKRRM